MKHLLTFLLLASVFGCVKHTEQDKQPETWANSNVYHIHGGKIEVVQIDSCEYLALSGIQLGGIIHKQNCMFCAERASKK